MEKKYKLQREKIDKKRISAASNDTND